MNILADNTTVTSPALLIHAPGTLDVAKYNLQDGHIVPALDELFEDLWERREAEPQDWPTYARECLKHPICSLLHQDPFTWRAFAKPRGYAGDAVMMDYIYGLGDAAAAARDATPLGREIFRYMDSRPSAKGVRYRRQLIAGLIDTVSERPEAAVLALASGHLREVELSRAAQARRIRKFVALDQDEASLGVVATDYAQFGVQAIPGSVREILAGKANYLGQYDFVYAAGLFDYLNGPAAVALARRMFEMTRPGGLTLIPNFVIGAWDRGYMEAFMDWRLIYRSDADMWALASELPAGAVADCKVFRDPDDSITFLLVTKAG